nr:hypothetical protein [Tanacetum cinerariifolium]
MKVMKNDIPMLSKSMTKLTFTLGRKPTSITNSYYKKKVVPDLPVTRSIVIGSEENEADHIEAAKITLAAQQPKGRKFQLEHCWRILKGHSKWDTPKPLDTEDHTEIFGPDVRPCPAGKTRPAKKTKSEMTGSSGGSASGSLSDYVSEDLRRKLQAGTSAYEAKKAKEMAMIKFKEMEFLTIDADSLPEPKASIIRNRQEKIIAKYTQQ